MALISPEVRAFVAMIRAKRAAAKKLVVVVTVPVEIINQITKKS